MLRNDLDGKHELRDDRCVNDSACRWGCVILSRTNVRTFKVLASRSYHQEYYHYQVRLWIGMANSAHRCVYRLTSKSERRRYAHIGLSKGLTFLLVLVQVGTSVSCEQEHNSTQMIYSLAVLAYGSCPSSMRLSSQTSHHLLHSGSASTQNVWCIFIYSSRHLMI